MSDMLVKLYALPERAQDTDKDYEIIRPMAPDKFRVVEWVKEHSGISAAGECDVCFSHTPVSMYIAVRGREILGYAYAVIGSVEGARPFYEKCVNAVEIPDSRPGIYQNFLGGRP